MTRNVKINCYFKSIFQFNNLIKNNYEKDSNFTSNSKILRKYIMLTKNTKSNKAQIVAVFDKISIKTKLLRLI